MKKRLLVLLGVCLWVKSKCNEAEKNKKPSEKEESSSVKAQNTHEKQDILWKKTGSKQVKEQNPDMKPTSSIRRPIKAIELIGGPEDLIFGSTEAEIIAKLGEPDARSGFNILYSSKNIKYQDGIILDTIRFEFADDNKLSGVSYVLECEYHDEEKAEILFNTFAEKFQNEYGNPVVDPVEWLINHHKEKEIIEEAYTGDSEFTVKIWALNGYEINLEKASNFVGLYHQLIMDDRTFLIE